MKRYLLVVALAVTPACGKQNDAQLLQHEAVTLVKYYQPKLDALDARVQAIFKRGTTIPGNIPGIEDVGRRLQEARDAIIKLRGIASPDPKMGNKSAVEAQADAAAKENKIAELKKLVHDTEVTLDRGVTVIDANLDAVESWIGHYDNKTLAMLTPAAPAQPEQPAAPEAQPPATGQPGAQPAADQKQPAPAQPKAEQPKAEQPKAAQPAPAQPKAPAPAPAPAQPKAAAPAPAPAQNK